MSIALSGLLALPVAAMLLDPRALGAAPTAALPAVAQAANVQGTVRDAETQRPLGDALVQLLAPGGSPVAEARSLEDGRYRMTGVRAGTYTLAVARIGFAPRRIGDVRVPDGGAPVEVPVALAALTVELNPTVVTASRATEKALDAPAAVTVVDTREIEERPAVSQKERVRAVPGVDVASGGLVSGTIVARGFNEVFSGSLLTLTDYRYAAVPSLRVNTQFLMPTPSEDIGRIEVVLGPASALYGPNSASGVLHILTRSPFDWQGTTLALGSGVRATSEGVNEPVGERAVVRGALRHAAAVGDRVAYKVTGQFVSGTDWRYADPAEPPNIRDFDVRLWSGEARVDVRPSPGTEAVLSVGRSNAGNALEATGVGAAQARGWRYDYAQLRARRGRLFAQTFLNLSDAGNTFLLRTGQPIVDRSYMTVGQLQHAFDLGARQSFTYGVDAQRTVPRTDSTILGRNERDDDITEVGGYVQSETRIAPWLDLTAATRLDRHSRLRRPVVSPRVALVLRPADNHNVRLTYNRAFSTPTTNNLFLDLAVQRLHPLLPYTVRTIGVPEDGFQFRRDCSGGLCIRSPFVADPTRVLPADATGAWTALVAFMRTQGRDLSAVPSPAPGEVRALLKRVNTSTAQFDSIAPSDVRDIPALLPTRTSTYEIGYKGLLGDRVLLVANAYRETRMDFMGPLLVETPSLFVDPLSLAAHLARHLPAPEAEAVAQRLASVPLGTVTPEHPLTASSDLFLTFRNFGRLTLYGAELAGEGTLSEQWSVTAAYAWMSDDFFSREQGGGAAGVPLTAPRSKGALAVRYRHSPDGLSVQLRGRHVARFPMNSGVYMGVVGSYTLADVTLSARPAFARRVLVSLDADNVFNTMHREFVGAPALGRFVLAQVQYTF